MKQASTFLHVGLTVSDIGRTAEFYEKYFGFKLKFKSVFPPEFISTFSQLYKQKDGVYSDFAFLESLDGIVLELFRFSSMKRAEPAVWNRPGYHHICLKVDDIFGVYNRMSADGVEFFFEPRGKGEEPGHWVFLKDPDGNMIELQD